MPLTTQFNKALRELLDAWRHHYDLVSHHAPTSEVLDARDQLETARLEARRARHMILG